MSLKDNFNQAIKEILRKDGVAAPKANPDLDRFVRDSEPEAGRVTAPASAQNAGEILPGGTARVPDADAVLRSVRGTEIPGGNASANRVIPQAVNRQAFEEPTGLSGLSGVSSNNEQAPPPDYASFGRDPVGRDQVMRDQVMRDPIGQNQSNYQNNYQAPPRQVPPPQNQSYTPGYTPGYNAMYTYSPERMEAEETTIISRNTVIDGNIRAFANVAVEGSVKGDIRITKDVSMSGRVVGDIECNNSNFTGASMQGNVVSKGQVQLDRDSLLLGDISAQYLNINGKIRGNVEIGGKAEFKSEAYILGNISASTITVIDGANIQGYVNTTAFRDTTVNVFPESIAVDE
jgi:cytoskeletal protein CcmA (bactofilin family)